MPTIRIKNIGAIIDTGNISISPIMLIVGKQSSGKSTFMKILCFCRWIEKKIMTDGENLLTKYTHYNRFFKELKSFHRLDNAFFKENSSIQYNGDCIVIEFYSPKKNVKIRKKVNFKSERYNSKLCFIPSERNLASAIQNIDRVYRSSDYDSVFNYLLEYQEARKSYDSKHVISMPFDKDISFYYDENNDTDRIVLRKAKKEISPIFASSGIQSALPLTVLVDYTFKQIGRMPKSSVKDITNLVAKVLLDNPQKEHDDISIEEIAKASKMIRYKFSQLYIEELEENLFPVSQFELIKLIIRLIVDAHKRACGPIYVVMTTHSPYVLTSLNAIMKLSVAASKNAEACKDMQQYVAPLNWFSAYCMTEEGTMKDIVDQDDAFISGDYLDSLSDEISSMESDLDDIIYGGED